MVYLFIQISKIPNILSIISNHFIISDISSHQYLYAEYYLIKELNFSFAK